MFGDRSPEVLIEVGPACSKAAPADHTRAAGVARRSETGSYALQTVGGRRPSGSRPTAQLVLGVARSPNSVAVGRKTLGQRCNAAGLLGPEHHDHRLGPGRHRPIAEPQRPDYYAVVEGVP